MLPTPVTAHRFLISLLLTAGMFTGYTAAAQDKHLVDSFSAALQKSGADTNRVRMLIQLGDQFEPTNTDTSIIFYHQAIELSHHLDYRWGEAVARQYLSEVYTRLNKYDSAASQLNIVMTLSKAMKDPKRIGVASNSMAIIYYRKGDYENALQYYFAAAEQFEKLDKSKRILLVSLYTNIGSVFFEMDQYDKSIQYNKQALAVAEEIKNDIEIAYAACEVGTVLQRSGNLREAMKYFDRAVIIADKQDDLFLKGVAHMDLGGVYDADGKYKEALIEYNRSLPFIRQYGDTAKIATLLGFIGRSQLKLQDYKPAEENLLTALHYSTNINDLQNQVRVYDALYQLENTKGNYKKAFAYMQLYSQTKDSLVTVAKTKSLNMLESKYQNEKKVKEIAQLKTQQVQQELVLDKRNKLLLIAGIVLAVVIILGFLLYKSNRQKQVIARQQQVLQQEQISNLEKQQQVISLQSMINGQETERTRMAKDLHDGLGGLFSTVKMHFSTLQHEVPDLKNHELYKKSYDLVNSASEELRKIAQNLMPEVLLKIGLLEALQDFCNNINASKLLRISIQAYGMDKRLGASTEIMLYRIIQELINNIIKHANATEAIIQFNKAGERLTITVEDNGQGFDMQEVEQKRSMGIQTVKSRVDYLNGKLSIDSRKDIGTTVMIDLLISE